MSNNNLFFFVSRFITLLIKKTDMLSAVSCRVVYWTGKCRVPLHPKHLIKDGKTWYLSFLKKSFTVLDIGCHEGQHAFFAIPYVKCIYGLDIDVQALHNARQVASDLKIKGVTFAYHNANFKFPFRAKSFDAVFFFAVLEHLKRRNFALKEVKRMLKSNGILLLSVPNKNTSWKRWQRKIGISSLSDSDHKIEFSKKNINRLLESLGFKIIRVEPVGIDMPFIGLIDLFGAFSLSFYCLCTKIRKASLRFLPEESASFQIAAQKKSL